jgi:methylisocitrate lyase
MGSSTNTTLTITVEQSGSYKVNGVHHEPTVTLNIATGATKLRRYLKETNEMIVCPGVYDGLSARIAMELGFKALYMVPPSFIQGICVTDARNKTGAGTTASRLGMADLGLAQLYDMRTNAEMIANLDPFGPPLIADMDTGYGGIFSCSNWI